jgi:hypothetical protein
LPLIMRLWIAALLLPASAFGEELEGETIELGARAIGSHADAVLPLERVRMVRLDDLPLVRTDRFDAQVGKQGRYLGIELAAVIARHPEAASHDLALLHFANGMIVPVPLAFGKPELDVFVARGTPSFHEVDKKNVLPPDPRPVRFGANKIVVSELTHPLAPDPNASSFSPWLHVDTLIAIELVDQKAWEAQFDAGLGEVRRGRNVFLARCQFCHAAREVGGKYGWDFVEPTPLYEHRKPYQLFPHVRFSNTLAAEAGAMMPPQKDVQTSELAALWIWMKAIAETGPHPYWVK